MYEWTVKAYTVSGDFISENLVDKYELDVWFYEVGEPLRWCILLKNDKFYTRIV